MHIRLDGRTALITGGSKGLGRAMAEAFAEAGAAVAIVARRPAELEAARAGILARFPAARIATVSADVATAEGCRAAYEGTVEALGPVDILVNNAGTSQRGPFPEVDDALWQADLDLKLFAAIRLTRLAWPGMAARRWGRVINVLATAAKAPPAEGAPTAVSRAAGMALTKVLSHEGAKHGILVNALLTGLFVSEQHERRHAASGSSDGFAEWIAKQGASLPLGRYGEPAEFAAMATFLASDAASYITGTAINLDGGRCPVV